MDHNNTSPKLVFTQNNAKMVIELDSNLKPILTIKGDASDIKDANTKG